MRRTCWPVIAKRQRSVTPAAAGINAANTRTAPEQPPQVRRPLGVGTGDAALQKGGAALKSNEAERTPL